VARAVGTSGAFLVPATDESGGVNQDPRFQGCNLPAAEKNKEIKANTAELIGSKRSDNNSKIASDPLVPRVNKYRYLRPIRSTVRSTSLDNKEGKLHLDFLVAAKQLQ